MENKDQTRPSEQSVMALVDSMAQAATVFAGQGYEQFLQARDAVKETLHNLCERRSTPRD